MELTEWAKLQEELLKAQLSVIRGYVRLGEVGGKERRASPSQRKSQMSMITDILSAAGTPLHVSEIIRRAEQQYGIKLDRESMVSALTKKVKKGVEFVRTGPNIFDLKGQ
jgi:hypothetical protein